MSLVISSWCWHAAYHAGQLSLLHIPMEAQRLGFTQVELNDFMLPPPRLSRLRRPLLAALGAPPSLWRYSAATFAQLAQASARIVSWTLDTDFTVGARQWAWQKRYLVAGFHAARLLKASVVRITLGGAETLPQSVDTLAAARLAEAVRLLAPFTVAVENHWGLSTDYARLLRILKRSQERLSEQEAARLGVCFDPGNAPLENCDAAWPALARAANHVHFKTRAFTAEGDEHHWPYARIFAWLKQFGFLGYFVLEYEGEEQVERGVQKSRLLFERYQV